MDRSLLYFVLLVSFTTGSLAWPLLPVQAGDAPYQATGIKIGEVNADSVIIWLRLTANAERVGENDGMPEVLYLNSKTGKYKRKNGRPNAIPKVIFPDDRSVSDEISFCVWCLHSIDT